MTSHTTTQPAQLEPVVDAVVSTPAVEDAWNSGAPIHDLVTAVILAATPAIVDRALRQNHLHAGHPEMPLHDLTIAAIQAEALAAAAKHGADNTPLGTRLTREEKLVVLVEEVGEVARALTYDQDDSGLVKELIQVTAMAATWAQSEDTGRSL